MQLAGVCSCELITNANGDVFTAFVSLHHRRCHVPVLVTNTNFWICCPYCSIKQEIHSGSAGRALDSMRDSRFKEAQSLESVIGWWIAELVCSNTLL